MNHVLADGPDMPNGAAQKPEVAPRRCPRCGHSPEEHHPEHAGMTTACTTCLTKQIITNDGHGDGTCCWPSYSIRDYPFAQASKEAG